MAPRNLNGVVDSSLKVWGTANLRVVDASIVPQHLAAHMQSTVYAIGEKVSAMHECTFHLCHDVELFLQAGDIIKSGSSTGNANSAPGGKASGWPVLLVMLGIVGLAVTSY
jgi:hypothetical protein